MWRSGFVLWSLFACGSNHVTPVDAPADSPPDAVLACGSPGAPHAATHYTLYLNTEGVTLMAGMCNDSRTNCTSLVMTDQVIPPFFNGDPTRQQAIDAIVADLTTSLAPYAIDLVTTRPASGDYYMEVLGGSAMTVVGSAGTLSVASEKCVPDDRDAIAIAFDAGLRTAPQYTSSILSDLGIMLGMPLSTKNGDCMCRTASTCVGFNGLCTFGETVPTDPMYSCGQGATFNEQTMLAQRLGCR